MLPRPHDSANPSATPGRLRFGEFELDCETPELWRDTKRIELPLQPLKVLVLLATQQGQVVSSDEIAQRVWGKRVVSWPDSLHVCIRQLRRALGESAGNAGIIQTVPRRGYRFLPEVVTVERRVGSFKRSSRPARAMILVSGLVIGVGLYLFLQEENLTSGTTEFSAFEAYEKGAYLLSQFPRGDLSVAAGFFHEAVATDPDYGAAWAGLADTYIRLRAFDAAEPAIERALELDPQSSEVLRIAGDLYLFRDWSVGNAKKFYRRAIDAQPDAAEAHQHLAMALAVSGDLDQAIAHMEQALVIEPVSTIIHADLGWFYYLAGDYDQSVIQCRAALDIEPTMYFPHFCLFDSYVRQANKAKAIGEARIILEAWGGDPDVLTGSGDEALNQFWQEYLALLVRHDQDHDVLPINFAYAYAGLRDTSMTLHWLGIAYEEHDPSALFIAVNPAFDFLRNQSAFEELIRRHAFSPDADHKVAGI